MPHQGGRRTPGTGPLLLPEGRRPGHPLDRETESKYRLRTRRMMRHLMLNSRHWRPRWRVCICLLLIGLIVYNPFVALRGTSGNLSYARMARNRATIGSSELQHFSPEPNPTLQPDLDVEVSGAEPATPVQASHAGMVQREVSPLRPELSASLWFRPPPAR